MSSSNPPITVATVTADLSDAELRMMAADAGLSGHPIPEIRRLLAIGLLSQIIFEMGQLSQRQSAFRAAEQLDLRDGWKPRLVTESSVSPQ